MRDLEVGYEVLFGYSFLNKNVVRTVNAEQSSMSHSLTFRFHTKVNDNDVVRNHSWSSLSLFVFKPR